MKKTTILFFVGLALSFFAQAQCKYQWLVSADFDNLSNKKLVEKTTTQPIFDISAFPALTPHILDSITNDRIVNPVPLSIKALIDDARKKKDDSGIVRYENMAKELLVRNFWPYRIGKKQIMMCASFKRGFSKTDSIVIYHFVFSQGDEWMEHGQYHIFYTKEFGVIRGHYECYDPSLLKSYVLVSSCVINTEQMKDRLGQLQKTFGIVMH